MSSGTYFITASSNRILHSYIRQAVIDSLADGDGLFRAIVQGHMAAFDVDMGRISSVDVVAAALTTKKVPTAGNSRIVACVHCHHTPLGADVVFDSASRRLCTVCIHMSPSGSDSSYDRENTPTIARRVQVLDRYMARHDNLAAAGKYEVNLAPIMKALEKQIIEDT